MASIKVTCKNEKEVVKVLEIAEKEGYTWGDDSKATSYRPDAEYPYDITLYKGIAWDTVEDEECHIAHNSEKTYIAYDFITEYNSENTEPFEISQKTKNKIILDFIKKWREIRMGCAARSCMNCKFLKDVVDGAYCQLDDVGNTDNARFLAAAKILFDVVASGDPHIWKLTPDEAIEVLEEEIKASKDMKDAEAQKRVAALKMAMRALEEKKR